ncbi:GntR family transcriptional regulator [Saccharopolyspora subtropica]|uniref:GntR family transcriptional regulator n=1 Tax=Saccharopolyspora thermophila TaxID=89367 RepID=A0A917NB86_9PSEU|nr:FadR/GntR family transcriptional regulator [Saccharopolyspora subtropica]GGI83775.1 GntR family transcriptional regulator [Saccharopolyspora subtropica]
MEAVLAHLRGAIERGEYAIGDKLPAEASLSKEFEVSRSVVREALRGLQALGLTVSRTGKGTFVVSNEPVDNPTFGPYSARDLLEVRRHVEVPAAGYAARRHTSDHLDVLTELLERMDRETDNTAWVALDSLFHITIAQASGNPVFGKVIEEIRDALARQSALLNQLGDRRPASNHEHRVLVEAISSGDENAATEAMTEHLAHVESALTNIVGFRNAADAAEKNGDSENP